SYYTIANHHTDYQCNCRKNENNNNPLPDWKNTAARLFVLTLFLSPLFLLFFPCCFICRRFLVLLLFFARHLARCLVPLLFFLLFCRFITLSVSFFLVCWHGLFLLTSVVACEFLMLVFSGQECQSACFGIFSEFSAVTFSPNVSINPVNFPSFYLRYHVNPNFVHFTELIRLWPPQQGHILRFLKAHHRGGLQPRMLPAADLPKQIKRSFSVRFCRCFPA